MDRRNFLKLSTASASACLTGFPVHGLTQSLPQGRICLIILEGGLDGLAAVPAVGDPEFNPARSELYAQNALEINPFFALHPSLKSFAEMLFNGEAAIIHATAFPYTKRSHFEGQNLVETGLQVPFSSETGWLGRAMDLAGIAGRALSLDTPLVIRGTNDLANYYPSSITGSREASLTVLEALSAFHSGPFSDSVAVLRDQQMANSSEPRVRDAAGLALTAGQAMRHDEGPRVSVIRVNDFDTHANQGTDFGRHARQLAIVDEVFDGYRKGLREKWRDTIVLTATEFGRTVYENGSAGTDHGYGSVGFLAGGLLKQSSVYANWPGLSRRDLYEERDLWSTLDYRAVCAACIEAALGLQHDVIAEQIFSEPDLPRVFHNLFG